MDYRISAVVLLLAGLASADEGMWTYNNFPGDEVRAKYGFSPTPEWLDHLRLSSARLAQGCSGSFVSATGLVMTNHHCAQACIQQLSNAKRDYIATGFYARSQKEEIKCPTLEVNQLVELSDVTDRINAATKGLTGQAYSEALKAEKSKIEKACATSDDLRCDVVTLYQGGKYNLYKYRRYQDIRLVFAPEFSIAFFGGDPDNFNFPRYDLDVSFLRVYRNNQPAKMDHYFKWSQAGAKDGDLTFVSGHPGRTSRLLTIAELEYQRDVGVPRVIEALAERRGLLTEFQRRGKEQKRISNGELFDVENSLKNYRGHQEALVDPVFFQKKLAQERDLRAKVDGDPELKKECGDAWAEIAKAIAEEKKISKAQNYLEGRLSPTPHRNVFHSSLFFIARRLLRLAEELPKPNEKRLREYTDASLPQMKQAVFSPAPIDDELEIERVTHGLTKMREELGADDRRVQKILGKASPRELATSLVRGSKLRDLQVREALFKGGIRAIEASPDPMIKFARLVDPEARAVRKYYEDQIESVLILNHQKIAKARFAVYGTQIYPDATFTLRLSYGEVKGWEEDGKAIAPITTMEGGYQRATGREPFDLPKSWIAAKARVNPSTPMNFCTTNDIIGGNSGSPVVDKNAEIVGLIFDGNIHSLGGDYGFNGKDNRAVAVHSAALIEALDKIYGAKRIVGELLPASSQIIGRR